MTGGVIEVPESASQDVTFDATLHKGSGDARGELLFRDEAGARFTLGLAARPEGDTVRLELSGQGGLGPLAPWLPPALVQDPRAAPLDVRANLGLSPGDRAAGRASAKLGDLATVEGTLSFQDKQLRVAELRGTADLEVAASAARLAGPVQGRAELADGEVTWTPERGGWPEARATLLLLEAAVPASAIGLDARATNVETRLELTPRETGAAVQGDIRGRRVELAGLELASVASPLRVDIGAGGVCHAAGAGRPDGASPRSTRAGRGDLRRRAGASRRPARDRHGAPGSDRSAPWLRLAWSIGPASGGECSRDRDGPRPARLERRAGRRRGSRAHAAPAGRRGGRRPRACPGQRTGWSRNRRHRRPAGPGDAAALRRPAPARRRLGRPRARGRRSEPRAWEARRARRGRAGHSPGRRRPPGPRPWRACSPDGADTRPRASVDALALGAATADRIGDRRAPVSRCGVRHLRGALDPEGAGGRAPRRQREPSRRLGRRAAPAGRDRARRRPRSGRAAHGGRAHRVRGRAVRRLGASTNR